jgi:hypothetical protein
MPLRVSLLLQYSLKIASKHLRRTHDLVDVPTANASLAAEHLRRQIKWNAPGTRSISGRNQSWVRCSVFVLHFWDTTRHMRLNRIMAPYVFAGGANTTLAELIKATHNCRSPSYGCSNNMLVGVSFPLSTGTVFVRCRKKLKVSSLILGSSLVGVLLTKHELCHNLNPIATTKGLLPGGIRQ